MKKRILFTAAAICVLLIYLYSAGIGKKEAAATRNDADTDRIPMLHISVDPDAREQMAESKLVQFPGTAAFYDGEGNSICTYEFERINSRGHNSFLPTKHGYSLKFRDKVDLFNMGYGKKYALFPCYRETSFLSYVIMSDIADRMNYEYHLQLQPLQVYINSEYAGLYLLAEKNEISLSRIDCTAGKSFIVEVANRNYYRDGEPDTLNKDMVSIFGEKYIVRDRNNISEEALIKCMEKAYEALEDDDKRWEYWDMESIARLLATGLASKEVSFHSSIFFLYDSNDNKLHALPLWDVEHAFKTGRVDSSKDEYFDAIRDEAGIYKYFLDDKRFEEVLIRIYNTELREILVDINERLDSDYIDKYREAMMADYYYICSAAGEEMDPESKFNDLRAYFGQVVEVLDKSLLEK